MGLSCQLLVFFIYQITKTLALATDLPSSPTPSPHRAEHQNLRMSLTIDPSVGQISPPPTIISIAPILSIEATPTFASGSPSLPTSVSPGLVSDKSATILPATQYPKDTSLDTLKPTFGQTSSFCGGPSRTTLPGLVNNNTPTFLPITYPEETLEPLKPLLCTALPFCDSLPPISSIIDPAILPLMIGPIETPRPVLMPMSIFDKIPSGLQSTGINPMIDYNPLVTSSCNLPSIQPTKLNVPLTDKNPSVNDSVLQLGRPTIVDSKPVESLSSTHLIGINLPSIDNCASVSPSGMFVPAFDNNPLGSSSLSSDNNLPFIKMSPLVSPSDLQLAGITVPMIDCNPLVFPLSIQSTGLNVLLSDKNPSVNNSELQLARPAVPKIDSKPVESPSSTHLTEINLPSIDNCVSVSPSGIFVPVINNNPLAYLSLQITENDLPLIKMSSSVSPSDLQLAGITVPIIDTNPQVNPSSVHSTGINKPLINSGTSINPSDLQLAGFTVPIINDNPLLSLNTRLTEKNSLLIDNKPLGLQSVGIDVLNIIDNIPLISPSNVHLTELNVPVIDSRPLECTSRLATITVPIIDYNPFLSPSSVQSTEFNLPLIDNSPSIRALDLQPARITVPIIDTNSLVSPSSVQLTGTNVSLINRDTPISLLDLQMTSINAPLLKNNPTVGPPSLKVTEVPITEVIANIPASRPIIDTLPYTTPYATEIPQIEPHVNIPSPTLEINFQIDQLNVPPNLQKKLPPLQYNCNPINDLEITPILTNSSPLNSVNYPCLDQLYINQQMVQPNIDLNKINFILPNNIPSSITPPNISSDIIFKESTKTVSPETLTINNNISSIDELKLDNTVHPNPKPEIPLSLQSNEYVNEYIPLFIPQNPSASLLTVQSSGIEASYEPIKPNAHLILNNELKTVQLPVKCSDDISVTTTTPSVSTTILENVSIDLPPNILPFITATTEHQFPKVVLNSIPCAEQSDLQLVTTRDDILNYNPANVEEQKQCYDRPTSIQYNPYVTQNILGTAQNVESFVGNTLIYPEQSQFYNTPTFPSPNTYIFENILGTERNLDTFVGSPLYPDVLSDSDIEYIKTMDSNKYIRSPYAISELETKLEPVGEPSEHIMSLTNSNILPIPLSYKNILNENPYPNHVLKDETLNNIFSPLSIMPSTEISSNIPLNSKNILDFASRSTLIPSFPRSLSPLVSIPPFELCTPFIKSPSFLPKPSLSKTTRISSNAQSSFLSSLLEMSEASFRDNVKSNNSKSKPCVTSITINIIPLEEESKSEILIIL